MPQTNLWHCRKGQNRNYRQMTSLGQEKSRNPLSSSGMIAKLEKSSSTLERTQRRDVQTYQSLRFWQSNCHLSQLIIFGYRRESSGEPVRKSIHFSHKIHQNRHLASTRFGRFSHCEVTMTLAKYLNCAGSGSSES